MDEATRRRLLGASDLGTDSTDTDTDVDVEEGARLLAVEGRT
jgi:hypothetical protein